MNRDQINCDFGRGVTVQRWSAERAAKAAALNAKDPKDCRLLLDMLGLIPPQEQDGNVVKNGVKEKQKIDRDRDREQKREVAKRKKQLARRKQALQETLDRLNATPDEIGESFDDYSQPEDDAESELGSAGAKAIEKTPAPEGFRISTAISYVAQKLEDAASPCHASNQWRFVFKSLCERV